MSNMNGNLGQRVICKSMGEGTTRFKRSLSLLSVLDKMMFWKRGTYTLCFCLQVFAFLSFFMISRADAYDTDVHKFITRQAVKFLIDRGIGGEAFRNEISGKENILALGAEHEDAAIFPDCFPRSYVDPSLQVDLRYLRHFYRPTDSRGFFQAGRKGICRRLFNILLQS